MRAQPFRLAEGGRIDRSRPLGFTFNGRRLVGYAGDTLAAALLANGVHLVARSFKYHRPRGIFSAGAEEPCALVQLGEGSARTDPNLRATQVELFDGLMAQSQNCWPSVEYDLSAVYDLISPMLPPGFYYKTFMWPDWRFYERFIRGAAGLGRAPGAPDPDTYDHVHAHCDVLVAGGGPAGLAAALAAGRTGARVVIADEQAELGGQQLSEGADGASINGVPAAAWVAEAVTELAAMAEVRLLPRTTVFGYHHGNFLTLAERVSDHLPPGMAGPGVPRQRLWKLRVKQVVLATGAIERPLVFAGNDRPGVMLAGASRTYLNRFGVRPGTRAVVFSNNDGAYRTALDLHRAGMDVAAIVDVRPAPAGALSVRAHEAGIEVLAGHAVVGTEGRRRLRRVRVMALDKDRRAARALDCDLLCVSGGWNPAVHLFSQSRGKLAYRDADGTFVPGSSFQAERSAGASNGAFALADCLKQGFAAGVAAAEGAGFAAAPPPVPVVEEPAEAPPRPTWRLPAAGRAGRGKAFVDLHNDVTAADLTLALDEGYRSIEHVKRYTTAGMGTDQGKTGNVLALGIIAESLGAPVPEIGVTTFRPPYTPVAFGAIAGRLVGDLFDPVRTTPMHSWHESHGAAFEPVGQWHRAWYYPRRGESMRDAVTREVKAARQSLGILDATTLGKIDIQGPDAAEFLNRVYTNAWSMLAVGRCRYGLMLGEDGMVMDDGVSTRLGDTHFHMTTTTGAAAAVMSWLEEWHQTEWPQLRVFFTSVTEQWAVISICGPNVRRLLAEVTHDIELDGEAFPHMSVREGHVAGVPARVFRISFTGELSYEINVPASHGLALWEALIAAGESHAITPFGTEAMHVLRAEKGFIMVGQETDGTVTPVDLGMDWIVSKKKPDFIGRRSLFRSDTARRDRKQLVGVLTEDPELLLDEGVHLIETAARPPVPALGHVTSSYYSPNVGRSIALALVTGGRGRKGERLYAATTQRPVPVTLTDPVFFDPDGARLHG